MFQQTNVIVVGGGYAGVMAANRLMQRDDVSVTLVNSRPTFVHRVRLHQRLGGSDDAVVDYREILATNVRLVVDTATRIDATERRVTLATGDMIAYDYLIYAVGSDSAEPGVPGASEFAFPISSLEEVDRLRAVVDAAADTAEVTVVGGGPLGIEVAAELAELGRSVILACGEQLAPYMHPRGRRSVARGLARLGVTVVDGPGAMVTTVTRDTVRLKDGTELPSAITIWAAGFGVPDLAARSELSTDVVGRLLTDETLTSVDNARIVATGDAAAPSDLPLRMSCQAAIPLGAHAAETVLSRIAGERPEGFNKGIAAMCVSLGRRAGVFQLAHRDDTATRLHVSGWLGAKMKEVASNSPIKQLANEARKPGSHSWPVTDTRRQQRLLARSAEVSSNPVTAT